MNNVPKLSDVLQQGAYNFGLDIQAFVDTKNQATRDYIDGKVAVLNQEDARVNGVINNLLKIADAQPGTAEWDEGQNLYTLISNNYGGLITRIEGTEADIATLQQFATQTTQDISTWMGQVNGRIDSEIARAQGEETAIRQELATLKSTLENKDALTDQAIATLTGRVDTLETAMANRVTEISALQNKQTENEARFSTIESKFDGLAVAPIVNEFRRGLGGQPSAFGHAAIPAS